jgi:hypothetical protein
VEHDYGGASDWVFWLLIKVPVLPIHLKGKERGDIDISDLKDVFLREGGIVRRGVVPSRNT